MKGTVSFALLFGLLSFVESIEILLKMWFYLVYFHFCSSRERASSSFLIVFLFV
jgi:hypothetical protein